MNQKISTSQSLGTQPIGKLLSKYAIPSIVSMLVGALYNIVDQIFIGQKVGELGNAATNVAFPLSTLCIAVALLFGIGGAASFNIAMGAGDTKKAANYIGSSTSMMMIVGIIVSAITLIFLTPLLKLFGSPTNVLGYARTYTSITALGFPFMILSNGGGHLIRADGSPKYTMICNLSGAIINTILDPIFIFVLNMDMAGAAIATVIGQAFSFILAIIYLLRYKSVKVTKKHFLPRWSSLKRILSLGVAPAFNQLSMMIVQIVMNFSLVYYGAKSIYGESIPLASSGVINKVAMLFFAILIGIAQGMQPIASFNYGAKQYDRVKKVYIKAITWGAIISVVAFLIFQIFPRPIISLFGSGSKEYMQFAISYLRIFMFFIFIDFVQPISANFFTSIGKPKRGMFISLTRQIIFLLPLIAILPLMMGIDGIVYAGPIADFLAAAVATLLIVLEFRKMKNLTNQSPPYDMELQ